MKIPVIFSAPSLKPARGFTLVELLIVVAIIGIIAAIAIPNLLSAIQRGKQKRTMGDMKTFATSLEYFDTDLNAYPIAPFGQIVSRTTYPYGGTPSSLDPDFITNPIWQDGWYSSTNSNATFWYGGTSNDYLICSRAKNVASETAGKDCVATTLGSTGGSVDGTTFDCDISLSSGQFVQAPLGKQRNASGC